MRTYCLFICIGLALSSIAQVTEKPSPLGGEMEGARRAIMSLDDCIAYAIDHNTQIKQRGISVEDARLQLHTSKNSRLPDLNASLGQGWSFGRSTSRDGTTQDITSANTNFSVSTSVPLFTAFRIPNQIKADQNSLLSAEQQLEAQKVQLSITITTYYLNALYYKGVMDVARQQLRLDSLQTETARAFVEAGRKAETELFEAEANQASAELQFVTAEGNYNNALLDLTQAMNWDTALPQPSPKGREIGDSILPENIHTSSLPLGEGWGRATILAAQYQLKSSEHQLKVAEAARYPTLSFGAGYSNSYYHSYDFPNQSFTEQLRLNGSEYLNLSLQIPIFNRFQVRNSVKRAQLNVENLRLQLDETRRDVDKQIQQAEVNARNAEHRLVSAEKAEQANELACKHEQERYNAGMSTLYTLHQAQQKLLSAKNDAIQARCELELRRRILAYYNK